MGRFSKISQNAFQDMQLEAGVILNNFNPASPDVEDEDIVCATTGGISITCVPSFVDFGEDVDNCPNNTKELKHLDGWDCSMATTALGVSPEAIKLSLGAADIDGSNESKIVPRATLEMTDFEDAIWWVGDRVDGGMVAVKLINALSTGGFSLQTTKKGKGQMAITIGGHVSINAQDIVPMEFYSEEGTDTVIPSTSGTTGNTSGTT